MAPKSEPIVNEKSFTANGYFDAPQTFENILEFVEKSLHYDVTLKDLARSNKEGSLNVVGKYDAKRIKSDYYAINLRFTVTVSGIEIEKEINGVKKKVFKGKASIQANSYIQNDWQNKVGDGPIAKFANKLVYGPKLFGKNEYMSTGLESAKDINAIIGELKRNQIK